MAGEVPAVDRKKFEKVIRKLLKTKPVKRSEIKIGKKKQGKIVPLIK